jgi:intein/homing endonuclease
MSDNIRSIPSIMDGLKPSQRKVLYTLIKRNFKNEIKVELLMGSVLEQSAYHHGTCLDYNTEINLADGTKIKIGEWAERYPYTKLLVRCIDKKGNEVIGIGKNAISLREEIEYNEIELEDGSIIRCTDDHKFFVNNKWIQCKNLKEGMNIFDLNKNDF